MTKLVHNTLNKGDDDDDDDCHHHHHDGDDDAHLIFVHRPEFWLKLSQKGNKTNCGKTAEIINCNYIHSLKNYGLRGLRLLDPSVRQALNRLGAFGLCIYRL